MESLGHGQQASNGTLAANMVGQTDRTPLPHYKFKHKANAGSVVCVFSSSPDPLDVA
jgi:hypothetical protein